MVFISYILILALHHLVLGHECERDAAPELIVRKQLRHDLECDYNVVQPPKAPYYKPATVTIKFYVEYFNLDLKKDVLYLETWMFLTWQDERLKWDPSKYGGVESIQLARYNIWSPIFNVYNSADPKELDTYSIRSCVIKKTGDVICVPRIRLQAHCNVKLFNFPYDVQECNFLIDLVDDTKSFNVSFDRTITIMKPNYDSSWKILEYREQTQVDEKRQKITLVFRREALGLAAVVVCPALIVSSLNVACLFLDFRLKTRLLLSIFSIFCHYHWLTEVVENIPTLSSDTPVILLYCRCSLALSVFIFLTIFILNAICKSKSTPHNIVIICNKFVYDSYLKFLVSYQLEVPANGGFNEDWMKLAHVVNRVCIIAIVVAYISLYIAYMPQITSVQYKNIVYDVASSSLSD